MKTLTFECYFYVVHDIKQDNMISSRIEYINYTDRFLQQRFHERIEYIWEKDESLGRINWPLQIKLQEQYKQDEELLSISDYSLGMFRKVYIKEWDITGKTAALRDYDSISNKVRFIKDSHIKKPYTRRNPFVVDQEG